MHRYFLIIMVLFFVAIIHFQSYARDVIVVYYHASYYACKDPVISLKDTISGTIYYVETNGMTVVAIANDGKTLWYKNIVGSYMRLYGKTGDKPVIRHMKLVGDKLIVTFGINCVADVKTKTGGYEISGCE